ncbi:MAG: hypothetical protein AAF282_18135 [Cyanobacteria bacterium P01_A01_bin.15]
MRKAEPKELSHAAETAVAEVKVHATDSAGPAPGGISQRSATPNWSVGERLRHNKPSSQTAYFSLGVMRLVGGDDTC